MKIKQFAADIYAGGKLPKRAQKMEDLHYKAIQLIQKQINKHRRDLELERVQPADVKRVIEKIRLLEYIMRVLKNEK